MKTVLIALAAMFAQSSDSQPFRPLGLNIWRGITKPELLASYPGYRGEAVPGCPAKVTGYFNKDQLASIVIYQMGAVAGCRDKVLAALERQLGPGEAIEGSQLAMGGRGWRKLPRTEVRWVRDGNAITFRSLAAYDSNYSVSVSAVP